MTIAIQKLAVPRSHRSISQNQSVVIIAYIVDANLTQILTDPDNVPIITIFNPSDTALVTDQVMTKISTGIYKYVYNTTNSDGVGIYTSTIKVIHAGELAIIEKISVFKVKRTTTLTTVTYLAIQDQNGVVWYWYVNAANELTVSATVPSIVGKQFSAISLAVTPYWLEINNAGGSLRYVRPDTLGDPEAVSTEPPTGSGHVGSPTLTSVNGDDFQIAVNISDEVTLNTV